MNTTEMIPHTKTPHNDLNSAYEEPLGVTHFLGKILVWVCLFLGLLLIGSCIWFPVQADMDAERRKQFESREMLRLFEETTQQQRQAAAEMRAAAEAAKGGGTMKNFLNQLLLGISVTAGIFLAGVLARCIWGIFMAGWRFIR